MHIDEIIKNSLKEKTLTDAISYACTIENERAVKQAVKNIENDERDMDGKQWDTCFRHVIRLVMESYMENHNLVLYRKENLF